MNSIEEQLKQYIKDNYGSVRAFVLEKGLIYANVDSILRRGIKNATWNNVKTLCEALDISADELAEGRIMPAAKDASIMQLENLVDAMKQQILTASGLTLSGQPASDADVQLFCRLLDASLSVTVQMKEDQA